MTPPLTDVLAEQGLVTGSTPAVFAECGFDARHTMTPEQAPAVARAFRDAGFWLEQVTCVDVRATEQVLRLVYQFNRFDARERHVVTADVAAPFEAPTIVLAFAAADWMEREVYDMFGVRFGGHPQLERLLLPEDADFHPLLKDFGQAPDSAPPKGGHRHG
jgi:NADH-quinone oxidoreductase subunit C